MAFLHRHLLTFMLIMAIILWSTGCTQQSHPSSSQIIVTTSISPLADLIQQVGGDKVTVTNLVPPGADPHDYEPKPEDVRKVAESQLFFANGVGEELYLNKIIQNSGNPQLHTIILSDGLPLLGKENGGEGNPHLWLDVKNSEAYAEKIRTALDEIRPANKAYFDQRTKNYLSQLKKLDNWIQAQINTIPPENRKMLVFHDAWPYFAKRYGLTLLRPVVYNVEAEPSAKDYAQLLGLIRQQHIKAIFGEAGFNPKLIQQLAYDTGIKYVGNLYDDTLGNTSGATSYIDMMKSDTQAIVAALR